MESREAFVRGGSAGNAHGVSLGAGDLSVHIGAVLEQQVHERRIGGASSGALCRKPVPPRLPGPTPAASRNGVKPMSLMLGLAPLASRRRATSISLPSAARDKGVAARAAKVLDETPAVASAAGAMHIELRIGIDIRGQQRVDDVQGRNLARFAGRCATAAAAPAAASSAAARAAATAPADSFLSTAMYRAVRPHQSQTLGFAPRSSKSLATS